MGSLLYYALAVNCTLLVALGDLAAIQTQATEQTLEKIIWLLNYAASHLDASITYVASDICLHTHSDASCLSVLKGRSRAGGFFLLSDHPNRGNPPEKYPINVPVHVISKTLKCVMGYAAEEIGTSYMNAQESLSIRTCLEEIGHPLPSTPIQVDNTAAVGFANKTIKQKRSKPIDMIFYWIQERCNQGQFIIYWAPGANNLADYHTKNHSPVHHKKMIPTILHAPHFANHLISLLRGCANTPISNSPRQDITHPQWGIYILTPLDRV